MAEYDFQRVAPSWQRCLQPFDRAAAKALGCSPETVKWLFPNPRTDGFMKHPEEWYWTNRHWFAATPPKVVEELCSIAGGFFSDLSLPEQARKLGLPLAEAKGRKAKGQRGMWELPSGGVGSVERLGMEMTRGPGDFASHDEGLRFKCLRILFNKRFEALHGHWPGFDETGQKRYVPSPAYTAKVAAAIEGTLADPAGEHARNPDYHASLWGLATLDQVLDYLRAVGDVFAGRMLLHGWEHGSPSGGGGHFDVTLAGPTGIRFVEIKAADRMHANQASWVMDVARPLGLDIALLRIKAA